MIKVIQQSTSERMDEIRNGFLRIKPFLDGGFSYNESLREAGLLSVNGSWRNRAWTRDVIEYAKKQGY